MEYTSGIKNFKKLTIFLYNFKTVSENYIRLRGKRILFFYLLLFETQIYIYENNRMKIKDRVLRGRLRGGAGGGAPSLFSAITLKN